MKRGNRTMISYNPLLCLDFYKTAHAGQYPATLTKMVSYYTPRMTRLEDVDKITMFGLQAFIQEYLIEAFNTNFFNRSLDAVLEEYERILKNTIDTNGVGRGRVAALHRLGYLPLEIRAVPEGARTNIKVPQIEISNTNPRFVWLVNSIETMLSCTMWHTQISAEVGYRYRQIVNKYTELTCDDSVVRAKLLGDFSMRGQESVESATKSSAAFCLSFLNTATVPAILWLEHNYACRVEYDQVAYGALSTEHSVMCSNAAVDGDEITHVRRLLTSSVPSVILPRMTRKYDISPICCSNWLLNTNATAGCVSSAGNSSPSVVRKLGALSGPGATLMMNSIKRLVPMSRLPLQQKMGITSRLATPSFSPARISSCVSVPFSK